MALQPSAANADVADVLTFTGRGDKAGEVGAALRRGRISAVILVQPAGVGSPRRRPSSATSSTSSTNGCRPRPAALYRFPPPPSTIAGLALTAAIVTAGAAACIGVGRARAWTLRRADGPGPVALAAPGVGSVATGTWSGSGTSPGSWTPAGLAPPAPPGAGVAAGGSGEGSAGIAAPGQGSPGGRWWPGHRPRR